MNTEIDLSEFHLSSGNVKWLPVVAAAFLRQLPQWRLDFSEALATQNFSAQIDLLHKLKGSCHAVAARHTVEAITQAEVAHALGKLLEPSRLLRHLDGVEAELRTIVVNVPAK